MTAVDSAGGPRPCESAPLLWSYRASNGLFLLYLLWASLAATAVIVAREGWVVVPLVIGLGLLGQLLLVHASRIGIVWATTLAFALYVAWGVFAEVTPYSDFLSFYQDAARFAERFTLDRVLAAKSPTTIAWFGGMFWLLGASLQTMYLAAALSWAIQIPLLASALRSFGLHDATARTAALLYGFSPSVIFYASLISSESVFTCLSVVCLWIAAQLRRNPTRPTLTALGVTCGLLFLTRLNGAVFLIGFAAYTAALRPLSAGNRRRDLATLLGSFLLILLLNGLANWGGTGEFSPLPSRRVAYNFLAGTNRASYGGYSAEDLELAGFNRLDSNTSEPDASRTAVRIAIERITADPSGFAAFALTTKLVHLWGTDRPSVDWPTARSPRRAALEAAGLIPLAHLLTEGFWLFLNLTAVLGLLSATLLRPRLRNLAAPLSCVVVLPMLLLSTVHIFLEVQPRYHMPYLPPLCILSAIGLGILPRVGPRHSVTSEEPARRIDRAGFQQA